ncbi:MAG TPA: ABC transporter substrate-binding protein [Baekduia sp.]|uniref:ABC transporter substrate-binding protein n=1 Tax=Baekduia sp. TaxID=2600305 RepID=UPI002D766D01|nr:ABC transporter substrate-binding protein [Baekduia sp.]HET6505320.1 ABC transporter substrate-binding protein [Baekduia sp.]
MTRAMKCTAAVGMLAAATALAACGGGGGAPAAATGATDGGKPAGALVGGATFTYAIGADPGGLDPATNLSSAATSVFPFAYDTLVAADQDNKIVPNLAERWSITPKVARFTLRDGATCADGSPVTAGVVAKNLNYLKSPKVQYPALGTLDYEVSTAGSTVTIRFGQPVTFLLQNLEFVPIVCGSGLADRSKLQRGTSGSGPYVMSEAVPNDHYTLTLRRGYTWGPDGASTDARGLPARVVLKVVPNETTTANLLLAGDLTAAVIRGSEKSRLKAQQVPSLSKTLGITQMFFNEAAGRPTADVAVRKALTAALDRAAVAKVAAGTASPTLLAPAVNPCPPTGGGAPIASGGAAEAGKLLDAAGWVKGSDGVRAKGGKRLTVTMLGLASAGPALVSAAQYVAETWRDAGVDVKSRSLSENASIEALNNGSWDVFPINQVGVTAPSQFTPFVSGEAPPKGANWGHVENADYDRLVAKAATTTGDAATCQVFNDAERALVQRVDVVPMVALDTTWFVSKKAEFQVSPLGVIPMTIRMHEG